MSRIAVVGGGFAGCAAAASAARAGAEVTLLERMELLGGCGWFAGRVDHKYFTAREKLRLMGGDDIFSVLEECSIHPSVKFPWPKPGAVKMLYDVTRLDPELTRCLQDLGVDVRVESRVRDVEMDGDRIRALVLTRGGKVPADAVVDATGGAGPEALCRKHANGCAMCFWRCPAFGGRVSIVAKAGIDEIAGKKPDGSIGPGTAAYSLIKESLAPNVRARLEKDGIVWLPMPKDVVSYKRTENITASANIDNGFAENVVLVDIGAYAKRIAGGYTPLKELRRVPGLERAIYADPYAGTMGNAVRYMAISPRDGGYGVPGVSNLFVAGEKLGVNGIGEVILTGAVAGHNAVRKSLGLAPVVLPQTTIAGAFVAYSVQGWNSEERLRERCYLFTGEFSKLATKNGLYADDVPAIRKRIEDAGLAGIFNRKLAAA